MSLDFPKKPNKVVCVTKTERDVISADNVSKALLIEDLHGEDVLSFITALTQEVVCPLLSNPENNGEWAPGAAEETLNFMERLKNEALVMKARQEGWTFLPFPKHLPEDKELKSPAVKLLHACESVIIEWAGLVSELLQQKPSQALLDGFKPEPSEEFNFWNNRLKNLQLIQQQMISSKAQQLASYLQSAEGAYCFILKQIYGEVQTGLQEAEDATQNLKPLQEKLEETEVLEYSQLRDNMAGVMEKVNQVWMNSHFHCKPCWIVVLLQEICNLLIVWSRKFLRGQEVMRGLLADPAKVLEDIQVATLTLEKFKEKYIQCRNHLEKQDGGSRRWEFPSHLVFSELDDFLSRMISIQEVYSIRLQFQLEEVVLAGGRGKMWTDAVEEVYQDFLHQLHLLSDCQYDASEPTDQSFPLQASSFQEYVLDLEARLVSILKGTLDDCCVSSSAVKILNMFGQVLDRPLIQEQLRPQLVRLVDMVMTELDQVEALIQSKTSKTDVSSKFRSSRAITLRWTQQLLLRAHNVLQNFQTVQHLCVDSGELVMQKFQKISALVVEFRYSVRLDWSSKLDRDSAFILEHPLIKQQAKGMMGIPFRDKLETMLSEIKQVSWERDIELHPQAAQLLKSRCDIGKSYQCLSNMVSCYNQVVSGTLPVELPLIQEQQKELKQSLLELANLKWSSEGVHQLVEQKRESVTTFFALVNEARANMATMSQITQGWVELPLLQRVGNFLQRGEATEESYNQLRKDSEEVLRLTQENLRLYAADDTSASWYTYLDHVDQLVQDGLLQLLLRSLHFLSDNMKPQNSGGALLQVSLQLDSTGSLFKPSLEEDLADLLKSFIDDVYSAASLPPRISVSHQGGHQDALRENADLMALEQEVMQHLPEVREEAALLKARLDKFSPLWNSNKRAVMQEFLTYGRKLTPDEEEVVETPPTLADFQREIQSLQKQMSNVSQLSKNELLHGWLQVELKPFKDALHLFIHNWISMYTQHLLKLVRHSMSRRSVDEEQDEDKKSSSNFPLTETIMLLETVGVEVPELTTLLQS
ncbi:dynein axonemal heavy chain 17-like isoform X1 [Nerophis ophidion]|uniref:dynein axonemal heavy chain 17-like isoform X1 n=2 Tax=Nerophis ophidion TaxID=159077 RepID=UPI002AE0B205|nr:dynein axonemal heavy chain 17-like isoform X1 [Nerophis ophidion]XP_061776594.1 dynein axonemal heavy chain 17-like isoform X1 [Nerophis ophidion]